MQKSGAQTARILPSSAREIGAKKDFGRKTKKCTRLQQKGMKKQVKSKSGKKVRFFPYFPYGHCSRLATSIEGKNNPTATALVTGGDPEGAKAQCDAWRKNSLDRARYICDLGYAKDSKLICGKPQKERMFRNLTRHGLTAFLNTPDDIVPNEEDAETTREYNGNKKETRFRSTTQSSSDLRDLLYTYATSPDAGDLQEFRNLLLETVQSERITPLSYGLNIIHQLKPGIAKYSQEQKYNIWRLSHINAMFASNNHLTYLDRRPHDTGFAIDGITDKNSYDAYVEKHGLTMAAYSYYTLSNWYNDNPGYFRITQTQPDCSEEAYRAWLETPAFYYTKELPASNTAPTNYHLELNIAGSQRRHHTICVGLATGKNVNYACFHGKPGELSWSKTRETNAKTELEKCVLYMKTQNPDLKYNDHVDFALYFCSSHHQFNALFERTKNRHAKKQKGNFLTDEPFTSMHAIPVNDSGTFLLWCLLEFSPMETEEVLRNSLMDRSEDFHFQSNNIYPLTYKGKRVFLGYTMDIAKINRALEDHLDGANFYIGCFPEQIAWYQRLMPGHEYL